MAIYPGAHYSKILTLKRRVDDAAIDITGWTFHAQLRDDIKAVAVMIELTTENGGFTVLDGPAGRLGIAITSEQSEDFSLGTVVGDVFRTDIDPGPVRLFGFKDRVKRAVTR